MKKTLLVVAFLIGASTAGAIEPGWYAPRDNGEGLIVRCNDTGGCALMWVTHSDDGQLWLISTSNCRRSAAVCDVALAETTGTWRGLVGETELVDPTVVLSVAENADGVLVNWDARALFPDRCFGAGIGDLLLNGCVGDAQFDLLAR